MFISMIWCDSYSLTSASGIFNMKAKPLITALVCLPALFSIAGVASAEGTDLGHGFNLSGNITVANDYRFRGYTQTNFKPAAQVGIDLKHSSGFYLGNWNSNVAWTPGASLEMDFYGGWSGDIGHGLTLDLGVLQYAYPGANMPVSPNTTELYVGVSSGPFSLKASWAPTNWFGYADSKNAVYLNGKANFPLGDGWGIGLNAGYQFLRNVTDANGNSTSGYFDYKAGVYKDIQGWVFDLSVVGASTDNLYTSAQGYKAGRVGVLFSIAKAF